MSLTANLRARMLCGIAALAMTAGSALADDNEKSCTQRSAQHTAEVKQIQPDTAKADEQQARAAAELQLDAELAFMHADPLLREGLPFRMHTQTWCHLSR
jgi:hypothetical protein